MWVLTSDFTAALHDMHVGNVQKCADIRAISHLPVSNCRCSSTAGTSGKAAYVIFHLWRCSWCRSTHSNRPFLTLTQAPSLSSLLTKLNPSSRSSQSRLIQMDSWTGGKPNKEPQKINEKKQYHTASYLSLHNLQSWTDFPAYWTKAIKNHNANVEKHRGGFSCHVFLF